MVDQEKKEFLRDLWLAVPYLQDYERMDWIILIGSLCGFLMMIKNPLLGLILLSIVDLAWAVHSACHAEYALAFLFFSYFLLTAWGCQRKLKGNLL